MPEDLDWTVVSYVGPDGSSPVEDFIDECDQRTQARLLWSIEALRQRNVLAREPLVRKITGTDLWELREESNTNIYRVMYVFMSERRIVLLHGFQKKTQRTPRREIDIAQRRLDDFRARQK